MIVAMAWLMTACATDNSARVATAREPAALTSTPSPTRSTPPPDRDNDGIPDSSDEYLDDASNTPAPEVTLTCYLDDTFTSKQAFLIRGDEPNFSTPWLHTPYSCEATRNGVPLTAVEQQAFEASGYDDPTHITTLYGICAAVDPTDTYTSGEHAASPEQIPELTGVLTLCPGHPLAAEFRATIERGQAEADLEASGQLIGPGTYLVGDEIQPGTYYVEGEIEGCYWERQDSAGEIIDNDFVNSARRVEVTIRSSDYAFHSEGCGQWRPVS
jgi:hypothetical protein